MHVPGWSSLHHHLHYVPGERIFTGTRVLVVCSACQGLGVGFVNRRLLGELVNSLLCQVALQTRLVLPSPSFSPHWLIHLNLVCVLFPNPIHLPPSCSPPSLSFFVPSHLYPSPSRFLPTFSSVVPSTEALSFSRD